MASNHTQHLGLSQWGADDEVLRTDFNADNARIDAAVGELRTGKADASALGVLQQTVAAKGNCRVAVGSYQGTGEYGRDHPTTLDFSGMGKSPAVIFIGSADYHHFWAIRGMPSYVWASGQIGSSYINITWTDTGLRWYSSGTAVLQLNEENVTYRYCALFD